jgi:AraC-like DNA-binding protein
MRDSVAREAGLKPEEVAAPDARLPHEATIRVWEIAEARLEDPAFGLHFAERLDTRALGVVGYFAAASPDLRTALKRVVDYHRLLKDPGETELIEAPESVTVIERPAIGLAWPRQLAEAVAAAYVTMPRIWARRSLSARAVTLPHPRPACIDEHLRIFGCVPSFEAPVTSITFGRDVLELPLVGGDAALSRYLAIAADKQLAALPRDDTLMRDLERAILAALPDGTPSIERVARAVGMGARTLQRKLTARGTCFQDVVDHARRAAAENLLADERLSIAEVAFLLGFSDASGLQRAHRRWTGRPPRGRAAERVSQ